MTLDPRLLRALALMVLAGTAVWLVYGEIDARQRRAVASERWRIAERQRVLELLAEAHDRAMRL